MRIDVHARVGFTMLVLAAFLTVPGGGCASEPKPRPTALDPSNPAAPESPPLATAGLSQAGEPPPAPAQDRSAEAEKAGRPPAIVYTCPMHPEVTADKPGRCPKCGMNLVPREPSAGKK